MTTENLIAQARARITWGEPASSVRSFLITNGGLPGSEADQILEELAAVRNAEIRKLGIKRICLGTTLLLAAGILFYFGFKRVDLDQMNSTACRALVGTAVVVALGGFYGVSKLIDGIIHLFRPQFEDKSISDI